MGDAAVSNLLEPGEKAVVSVSGIWGERFTEKCLRHGAEVVQLRKEAGLTPSYEEIAKVLEEEKPAVLFLCHGESSSGTKQNLDGIGELCKKTGTLLVVDTVCTLVGEPFFTDAWGIDLVYSGAQKCIGCPPGLSPMTYSERAMDKVMSRKTKPELLRHNGRIIQPNFMTMDFNTQTSSWIAAADLLVLSQSLLELILGQRLDAH